MNLVIPFSTMEEEEMYIINLMIVSLVAVAGMVASAYGPSWGLSTIAETIIVFISGTLAGMALMHMDVRRHKEHIHILQDSLDKIAREVGIDPASIR